ncbi:hypothetical protein EYZ11_013572 [Aspergillus tanneri]|uniref:Uncharacterized protein n=1 Tax=Aspergillus tanneri TaxID=1220188 RepID=A0A4S3IXU9_9EURO|nr:hypothetical protein EYZ11_013572 [Aspergillus tanneri]
MYDYVTLGGRLVSNV